jgi:hypothetical protein
MSFSWWTVFWCLLGVAVLFGAAVIVSAINMHFALSQV